MLYIFVYFSVFFFFSSRRRHTRCALVTGVQTCALPILAGPEIGVASTKAFTTQLTLLACFAIACARARGTIDHAREAALSLALTEVPGRAAEVLNHDERIREIGRAHVCTPVTNAHLVRRLLLATKKNITQNKANTPRE